MKILVDASDSKTDLLNDVKEAVQEVNDAEGDYSKLKSGKDLLDEFNSYDENSRKNQLMSGSNNQMK